MGLDNGLVARNIKKEEVPSWIDPYVFSDGDLEFGYWRKCWGLRNEILDFLHSDKYSTNVDREDLPGIIKIIKKYLHEDYWLRNADSIWEYDEYLDHNIETIMNLLWLYKYWESHPNIELYFYDSY